MKTIGSFANKPNSDIEVRATVVGSSRCDDLARVHRAKGIVQEGTNANTCSAANTAWRHRSAMTLPAAEFGMKPRLPHRRVARRRAFTLIELLVVIAIIAI